MNKPALKALSSVVLISLISSTVSQPKELEERQKKHFSLFSVVTFKNEECTSELTGGSGGARAGTCQTSTECSDMKGTKSGNCAAGFGVCCVILSNTGATAAISHNRTYIRNSEYSAVTTSTTKVDISYTISKMSSDICQLRLDFVDFVIAGPSNSLETIGVAATPALTHCTNDYMTITNGGGAEIPTICGANTGEHLYIDMGSGSADTTVIRLITAASITTLTPAIAKRLWDIKTSQIECYSAYRAPEGCHRYMTTDIGKIISYNFMKDGTTAPGANLQNTGVELASQNIKTCIRRNKGMCCVEFLVCARYKGIALTDAAGTASTTTGSGGHYSESWSIDTVTYPFVLTASITATANQANVGAVDAMCPGDHVEIPSSWSGACGAGHSSGRSYINTRYCGARLGISLWETTPPASADTGTSHVPVCDCSEPFSVTHISNSIDDNEADVGGSNTNLLVVPRGFCLDYRQAPCYY